ncbi:hypothetical protein GQR58_028753 [Nymphon striatum]|nr:hypothetical protein GQR58_028753 [Nymphon striatum]
MIISGLLGIFGLYLEKCTLANSASMKSLTAKRTYARKFYGIFFAGLIRILKQIVFFFNFYFKGLPTGTSPIYRVRNHLYNLFKLRKFSSILFQIFFIVKMHEMVKKKRHKIGNWWGSLCSAVGLVGADDDDDYGVYWKRDVRGKLTSKESVRGGSTFSTFSQAYKPEVKKKSTFSFVVLCLQKANSLYACENVENVEPPLREYMFYVVNSDFCHVLKYIRIPLILTFLEFMLESYKSKVTASSSNLEETQLSHCLHFLYFEERGSCVVKIVILGGLKDPGLLSENICHSSTLDDVPEISEWCQSGARKSQS